MAVQRSEWLDLEVAGTKHCHRRLSGPVRLPEGALQDQTVKHEGKAGVLGHTEHHGQESDGPGSTPTLVSHALGDYAPSFSPL